MKKAQKLERAFLKAKGKFEQAQADASAKDAMLATSKQQTATIFERLQTSSTALEQLRQQKASQDVSHDCPYINGLLTTSSARAFC